MPFFTSRKILTELHYRCGGLFYFPRSSTSSPAVTAAAVPISTTSPSISSSPASSLSQRWVRRRIAVTPATTFPDDETQSIACSAQEWSNARHETCADDRLFQERCAAQAAVHQA
jgi:hypothetical protein